MRLERWNELRRTFRFRLALRHMQFMLLALMAALAVSYFSMHFFAMAEAEHDMTTAVLHAQQGYLGRIAPPAGTGLPDEMRQAIEAAIPGFHIGLVELEELPGGWEYEVIGSTGSEQIELFASPPDRLTVVMRRPLSAVVLDMKKGLDSGTKSKLDLLIVSSAGERLGGTPPAGYSAAQVLRLLRRPEDAYNEPLIVSEKDRWLGVQKLYDGNYVCVFDREPRPAVVSRALIGFFVVLILLFLPLSGAIGFDISRRAMAGVERVSAAAGRVKEGRLSERVASGDEGTEIHRLAAEFNSMLERIESLMQELRDVSTNIAHDLRTPVARVRGMIESMNWAEIPAAERELIAGAAIEECDRMMPLIDSILELARADAGMLVLQQEPVDLSSEVRAAHRMFSTLADDKEQQFTCSAPDSLMMTGDRARMQRMISNLVDNAIKFTPPGGSISLNLELQGSTAVLAVQDSGEGIDAALQDRVFERFYRVDASRTAPGYGLGLSQVHAFAKAMGGSVSIQSDLGAGCRVIVRIPVRT